jgi:hypothetical protein
MPLLNSFGYLVTCMRMNAGGAKMNEAFLGEGGSFGKTRSYIMDIERITRLDCLIKSDFIAPL